MDLKTKYSGKTLTTDEVAQARTEIEAAVKELEGIEYKTGPDSLLLKWGTLKGWDLHSDKGKALLKRYSELGMTMGAMDQKDTPEQKELICQMIDECDGVIQNDWDGNYYTKQEAKQYIKEYS